ncbi:MAG: serine/threonine-protein kinase [Rothia sp. (in: high G+C Gram-positive bacteria)]|uniref:serine/threonine protein kinase n=1 Tax=Rothia sp. (in: high G+C Gram-positive bacteria) TaxID=1885016 RepID=UPI0026DF9B84|nr:serine/threonine-protein kinase [Rothia sp. (in: high G+C Gram-positive bacteria)]MDO5751085.1 serine/threonine-protein kinase [Rothia sp. (in: high G+C Gram-positive bacteria)]
MSEADSLPKTHQKWLTGATLEGRYQVHQMIGRGGMSEVYYATDLFSNASAAVKVLSPRLALSATNRQKFHREEASLRRVRSDHTIAVLSSGTEYIDNNQVMYMVLEYVHGCTLSQLLSVRSCLSLGETLELMLPVVEGLSEVHAHRFVHRDIKPGNILIGDDGTVKLADFGLTRRDDQIEAGAPMGTPAYTAPEVLDPQAHVGAQADIFAIGVMMYRMLAGRLPFVGLASDQEVLFHNANVDMPAIASVAPGIDRDIAGIIAWCTNRNPAHRPEDAAELFAALTELNQRLSPADRAWRNGPVPPPLLSLHDEIDKLTANSGRDKLIASAPISAINAPNDLLISGVLPSGQYFSSAESLQATDAPVGFGPATRAQSVLPPTLEPEDAPEILEQVMPGATQAISAGVAFDYTQGSGTPGVAGVTGTTANVMDAPPSSSSYTSPSGSMIHGAASPNAYARPRATSGPAPAEPAPVRPRNPRVPEETLGTPLDAATAGIGVLGLIFLMLLASFLGWLLATSLLQSAFWQGISKTLGL